MKYDDEHVLKRTRAETDVAPEKMAVGRPLLVFLAWPIFRCHVRFRKGYQFVMCSASQTTHFHSSSRFESQLQTWSLCSGATTGSGSLSGLGEVRQIATRSQYHPLLLQHSAKTRWEDSGKNTHTHTNLYIYIYI